MPGDAKKQDEQQENLWENLLSKLSPNNKEENATLVVFGDKKNGKGELLKKLKNRISDGKAKEYLLDYSYVKVKNVRDEADPDDVRAIMNVWEVDNPDQAPGLLPLFLKATGFKNALYVITLDLSQPWSLLSSLQRWAEVLTKGHFAMFEKLPEGEQKALKDKISAFNQFYVDPTKKAEENTTEQPPSEIKLDPSVPKINLGVPLVVVGCKADMLASVFANQATAGDRFEFITRKLRQFCLDYGAGLVFTSSFGPNGSNVDVLQEYIYHRLYKFELVHKPKVVGSETEHTFFVPSGHDSIALIDAIKPAKRIDDAKLFDEVFKKPAAAQAKDKVVEEEIKAEDNQIFFNQLKFQMNTASSASASSDSKKNVNNNPASNINVEPAQSPKSSESVLSPKNRNPSKIGVAGEQNNEVVRVFFQSLLNQSGGRGAAAASANRSQVHTALNQMRDPAAGNESG